MTRRITAEFARTLIDGATNEWDGDVSPSGIPCLTGYVPDASEPEGKRHVVIAEFHGVNDMEDLALASNAKLLAESLIAAEGEPVWLRKLWRLQDRVIGALHLIDSNHAEGDDAGVKHAGELYEECVGELADFENENTEAIKVLREVVK